MSRKYYWLRLKDNFFTQPKIKKLRRIAGGDTYTTIYLKLMLLTINNEGVYEYEGIFPTLEEELSLTLDEDATNVSVTINYMMSHGLLTQISKNEYKIVEVIGLIGSETATAQRMRKMRANKAKQITKV